MPGGVQMAENAESRVRAGTGLSTLEGRPRGGPEAATAALAPLGGEPPALVMVFATPRYDLPRSWRASAP